ncbi:MAG: hypothetical protein J07HR59_00712 [Halorubrum sp. J07HR59]|nr:MAG: hypothetical protein J07HR59_00712 [Halorubrum sp. J07HR59]
MATARRCDLGGGSLQWAGQTMCQTPQRLAAGFVPESRIDRTLQLCAFLFIALESSKREWIE